MLNRKGAIATDQLFGALRYSFVLLAFILIFSVYNVLDLKKANAQITASTNDLDAAKSLNYFLEYPVDIQNTVLDLIVESYKSGNYDELNKIQREYFSGKYDYWKLIISDQNDNIIYESNEFRSSVQMSMPVNEVSESEVNAFVIGKESNIETATILLQAFT